MSKYAVTVDVDQDVSDDSVVMSVSANIVFLSSIRIAADFMKEFCMFLHCGSHGTVQVLKWLQLLYG